MSDWADALPAVRGKIVKQAELAPFTWFRVGGPADVLFLPEDEADLATFLKGLDPAVPVTPIGVGSNLLVRDGGLEGVVVRLGRNFAQIVTDDWGLTAGAAALDAQVAKVAARAGLAGLEFYAGIPGTVGGAVTMNAGCYGRETKDALLSARIMDRSGNVVTLSNAELQFAYRHSILQEKNWIVLGAAYELQEGNDPSEVIARIEEITAKRETSQPIREKTGGSTFKNPEGHSAWKLVDEAGWRGKFFGGAKFSELHSNFMINADNATAADLEGLGDTVRAEVKDKFGIDLHWEIKRIGRK
ncbi:UDP-N-acetylmuramate dehydrogenase [Asticcacaulis excentricus]|uniref:UDP-N-acetylenolpyruvoylglucosamine reductase n=1 Tax=Asticcacaulis excentricus (strain ATCC 15261 / DSM 4724 / KCTC 12464 / NCIMB 9791 / VKM B-1370 / CB 48) TaxID=573065 RepID=E8RRK1_ASTEC|nr:UDP-N-acetylmuramate dehydrogenase [Asticcacaulis excentricus]ADU13446.1 UDP-N-acetylenolpyruvoylglucosamine reductase [Asticcacaulis excentricus CB 48]